jgi:hypothetical protein
MASSPAQARAALLAHMVAACQSDLSKAFAAWLLQEREGGDEFAAIVDRAARREGAEQDFQTAALLGFAADAGVLSTSQLGALKNNLHRLAGRNPVINGLPMAFCGDAVGVLGVVVGTRALSDPDLTSQVARWAVNFLRASYERGGGEEWQRSLFAVAGRHLDKPLELAIPESAATADVRTALLSRGLIDFGDRDREREDAVQTLKLAVQEPPTNLTHDRAALRLAAVEWVIRKVPTADQDVPLTPTDGSIEWIDSQTERAGRPFEPSATEERTESAQRAEADRRTGIFGTAGQPKARPKGGGLAANPQIRKLVEEDPAAFPLVNLAARFEQAKAEAEVAFRQSELKGNWAEWSGVFPWESERDPDTTDCPWWVAGAEYVFHVTAAWRKYSPGEPEKIEALLPKQIELSAKWVYHAKVRLHDIMRGQSSNAEHILIGHADRFFNIAFLFSMQKFAEIDLDEWSDQATRLAGAITDLNQSVPRSAPAKNAAGMSADHAQAQAPNGGRTAKKPVGRRGRPPNHERRDAIRSEVNKQGEMWREHLGEIFTELDSRGVLLGDFHGMTIDLGEGKSARAWTWTELDLAEGEQRKQIIDALRKYARLTD